MAHRHRRELKDDFAVVLTQDNLQSLLLLKGQGIIEN